MLIGRPARKPDLTHIRRVKRALLDALDLPEDAWVTVAELACREADCAPLETVVGLLRPGSPQRQHTVHKRTSDIQPEDLMEVCKAWGLKADGTALARSFNSET